MDAERMAEYIAAVVGYGDGMTIEEARGVALAIRIMLARRPAERMGSPGRRSKQEVK